ncbi:DUF2521 family protein [Heyndrickxia ginsengihumi]|uniref:DUF2521 family protein n=1 Tax=Heyndrickxia ginsengihumi TaxID=363870 RepID=UPI003D1B1B9B
MNDLISLASKRRERQIKYERKLLRELPVQALKKSIQSHFNFIRLNGGAWIQRSAEEGCGDLAIEFFLLGGHYSRFGFYGETIEQTKKRCAKELKELTDTLYNDWQLWTDETGTMQESLYYTCEQFIDYWWTEGFKKAEKRRKLRLH